MCRCDFCCSCPHQTYLQIFHNKGISRRLLNIHSLPATLSAGKRWKEMSLLDEYRNSQGHSGTQQQNSAKQPLPMPAKPRSRWGFRWPWIESIRHLAHATFYVLGHRHSSVDITDVRCRGYNAATHIDNDVHGSMRVGVNRRYHNSFCFVSIEHQVVE